MPRLASGLRRLALLGLVCALLSACGAPATLKPRAGYWADQSVAATAYNHRVRFLVLHYTDSDGPRSLKVLTGPRVSAHYLVGQTPATRGGAPIVRQLVPENERAWHAGVSSWAGRHQINDSSIGIEIVNQGPYDRQRLDRWHPFDAQQIAAVTALARDIINRYDIDPANVVAHSDIAPGRKIDPGPAFPWQALHRAGVGAWPDAQRVARYRRLFASQRPDVRAMQSRLAHYGYDLDVTGVMDARTRQVLRAFQMHFRPSRYDGTPDIDTLARLWALDDQYR
ncbi:N-acetylmuramoyl-L-alanine amidase [Salinisphaera sp. Q1T1-3]|uniref:N-acetylmuramoyl-L-alanine amidase n=1 Tax=Salinisphaera sp. Q1T1-3 TaxID=2321229 RepID=UPI000E768036|nr:N-acetylmuramoyl-L-alanine amidase [Salinisphaera sp. Q1T1-3]RJS95234.1 N-acetylmuramoyl-L-alanine amidase [Salinisphaera sp. Q1T1-3]